MSELQQVLLRTQLLLTGLCFGWGKIVGSIVWHCHRLLPSLVLPAGIF